MKNWFTKTTMVKLLGTGLLWTLPCGMLLWLLYFTVKPRLDSSKGGNVGDQADES